MGNVKIERIKVTPDELRNGWDDASLRKYLEERNEAQIEKIDQKERLKNQRPAEQNHCYRPHRWRS